MEQRKLIRLGNSSFAIALPKDWVDKSGLKKGDDIFIERNSNGELIVVPKLKKKSDNETLLDLKEKEETLLQTELIGSYLQDCNVIKIKNNIEEKKMKHVKELLKNLMSFEIVEENKEETKMKDVFDLNEANVKSSVRRIDNIVRSFFEDISLAIKSKKITKELSNEIQLADKEVTKLYLLIGRIFMKSLNNPAVLSSLNISSLEIFNYWWTALHIERIGDDLKYIARILEKSAKFDNRELTEIFETITQNYIVSMNSHYHKDKNAVKGVIENNKKIISRIDGLDIKEADLAQMSEIFKSLQGNIFQISKMLVYTV